VVFFKDFFNDVGFYFNNCIFNSWNLRFRFFPFSMSLSITWCWFRDNPFVVFFFCFSYYFFSSNINFSNNYSFFFGWDNRF